MRVLQAMAGAEAGGAEEFFVRLVLALRRSGLDQRVAIRRNSARAEQLRVGGLMPIELRFGGIFDFWTRRALAREIDAFRPDVVVTWMSRATRHCPKGRFVHVGRLGGYYNLKYYGACGHLIGNTPDIVSYCTARGWASERVHYLPNFVDAVSAQPMARKFFDTPDEVPLFLAAGRFHANKAFDTLIRALASMPDAHLWLAGAGPLETDLKALATRLHIAQRVRFLGWRKDVPALLAAVDALVCPSRVEPLGNVILEAWAHGKPVVAAASSGPKSLIEHGKTGLLVGVDDAAALSLALRDVALDKTLAARLAAGGRAAYEASYTEAAVVRRYLDFFSKVAA
jgi:glycosyltransferase involved in cell wall biosynthesis